jgi:hypothetical protein
MDAVALVRLALGIISDRLITIMALLSSTAMGCWAMYEPVWERVASLAIFVVFAYLLVKINLRISKNEHYSES